MTFRLYLGDASTATLLFHTSSNSVLADLPSASSCRMVSSREANWAEDRVGGSVGRQVSCKCHTSSHTFPASRAVRCSASLAVVDAVAEAALWCWSSDCRDLDKKRVSATLHSATPAPYFESNNKKSHVLYITVHTSDPSNLHSALRRSTFCLPDSTSDAKMASLDLTCDARDLFY